MKIVVEITSRQDEVLTERCKQEYPGETPSSALWLTRVAEFGAENFLRLIQLSRVEKLSAEQIKTALDAQGYGDAK